MDDQSNEGASYFSENDDNWNQNLFESTNLPLNTYKSRRYQNVKRNSNKPKDTIPKQMNNGDQKAEEEMQAELVTKSKKLSAGSNGNGTQQENLHEKKDEESDCLNLNNNHDNRDSSNDVDLNLQSEENIREELGNEKKITENQNEKTEKEKQVEEKREIEPKKKLRKSQRLKNKKKRTKKEENERCDSEGHEIFYPEKIVRDRIYKGRKFSKIAENGEKCREYFIKWYDWPSKDNTWEHEQNLIPGASEMLEEYWSQKKKKQAKKQHRKSNQGNTGKKRKLEEETMSMNNSKENKNINEEPPMKKSKVMSKEEIEKEWENRDGEDYKKYCLKIKESNPQKFFEFFSLTGM